MREDSTGKGSAGEGSTGEGSAGEGSAGEGSTGEGSTGAGSTGADSTGEGSTGEGSAGEGSAGEGSAGEGSAGDAVGRISSRPVHDGRIVRLSIDTVRFPDGSTGELEMVRHSGASAVLPVLSDPEGDDPQILLIRQYRYASDGYMLEVPAGRPDQPGEDWEVCARRELAEETGLVAGALTYMTTIYTTPGFTDEQIRLYMATDCVRTEDAQLDHDEFIEPVALSMSDALRRIRDGEITDCKTICCILYAAGFLMQ
jgi:ADP-ribose pyrophosphatase